MKKFDEKFQDCLLMECIEYINSMRPVMEQLKDLNEDEDFYLENIDIIEEQTSMEHFAMTFFKGQHDRFKTKYNIGGLDEYMGTKADIYEAQSQE